MTLPPTCNLPLPDGAPCALPIPEVPERFLLVAPDQVQAERCLLHRTDNQLSRVLAVIAERRYPVLAGVVLCPCSEACGAPVRVVQRQGQPGCLLELHEAVGLIARYLDAVELFQAPACALTDQLLADLIVRRLILTRVEAHLVGQGIIEEIRTTSDAGEKTTIGKASSLLRTLKELAQSIREDEKRLMPPGPSAKAPDDRWLVVTDDRTQPA